MRFLSDGKIGVGVLSRAMAEQRSRLLCSGIPQSLVFVISAGRRQNIRARHSNEEIKASDNSHPDGPGQPKSDKKAIEVNYLAGMWVVTCSQKR